MMSLLVRFRFFYDDWGSMIAIFFTIASAFIEIDAAMWAEPLTTFLAKMHERVFDDQKFADIFDRVDRLLP